MSANKPETRKRRREWGIIVLVLALLGAYPFFKQQIFDLAASVQLSNNVLVMVLTNINILLIVLFLFLIIRNLFKMVMERRRNVPGSKLRARLVLTFVLLSLIPTMLLFFTSAGFITKSIDSWFSSEIETALSESLAVAQTYYKNSATNALYYAEQLATNIKNNKLLNEGNLDKLRQLIKQKQKEYNLGVVEVFSATHEELVRAANPAIPLGQFTDPGSEAITAALRGERFTRITPTGKADLIRGIVPIHSNWNPKDCVGVVVVNYYVPYSLVNKMQEISSSYQQYKSAQQLRGKVKQGYISILLLIALVIIFLATWLGFRLARSITVPLQELVIATRNISTDNLDVTLPIPSDDEIGILIDAFDKMTADLRREQERIKDAHNKLQNSNIELDQRRRYMEIVLKNVTAGIISLDSDGVITTINKSAETMLKIKGGRVLHKKYQEVVNQDQLQIIRGFLGELLSSNKESIKRQISLSIQGQQMTLLLNVTSLHDENGQFMGTVIVFDDLTQLQKAQRMEAWREVARRIAHEIKNPLTPVQLSAQRLRRRYLKRFSKGDNVFDECTNMIINQVEDLKNLVNEFSNFARMPASNPTLQDLNAIISETLFLYQEGHRNVIFKFDTETRIIPLKLDKEQFKRVIINLLDNAVHAVEQIKGQGEITLSTKVMSQLDMVTLTISDNGCGINEADKPRLFEPYFSTKSSGTGLGLAIVSTIISDHNGYIRVKDNEPQGTQIIIELPMGAQPHSTEATDDANTDSR
ncbi:MAG: PAS domain-containing sensor histidine kinase [Desulfobacteraceae bacterium 4572_35.1]|nr:MAG: PAS domain-containing sensor histidine kinase [Desulfobacteraceae bacterium 4572_35.1]